MRRIRVPGLEGADRAQARSPAALHRDPRADPPAVPARVCGDDRRPGSAGGGRRRRPIVGEPGPRGAVRRVAELHDRRRRLEPERNRPISGKRPGLAGRRDSAGFADGLHSGAPQTIQVIADGSDANSAGVAVGYATNLMAHTRSRLRVARERSRPAGGAHRAPDPRLVQPAARKPRLHDSRGRRAAAAGGDDQPVVDGHRPREGDRHARAVERHPARAGGS